MKTIVAVDVETYHNFFLIIFKAKAGKTYRVIQYNDQLVEGDRGVVRAILKQQTILTFNGIAYDIPLIAGFLCGYSNDKLKKLSDVIVRRNVPPWELPHHFPDLVQPATDHIDLVGATPLQASLKTYACRIHAPTLQDLPVHPDKRITREDAETLIAYCENDVDLTWYVYEEMTPAIELRKAMGREYGQDFRSKSEPQIAEAVIRQEMLNAGHSVGKRVSKVKPFGYKIPPFIKFNSPIFNDLLDTLQSAQFKVNDKGYVELPDELNLTLHFKGAAYQLGIGGLHSQEKHQAVIAKPGELLGELDVASMYPSIILGQGLYPEHLGDGFCEVYADIYHKRLEAKKNGNKLVSDSLKLVLNSSYGKFGSRYSFLYSPELLIQTTITGQLALLMLIERLSYVARVVSANTDGVVVLFDKDAQWQIDTVASHWTHHTTYQLEWTPYHAIYSESVNSYVAVKEDGVKCKGLYAPGGIGKGYANQVCIDAVCEYLTNGTPVDQTIRDCGDIRKFLTMRGVRGGAQWRGQELGKVVRWYVSTDGEPIHYISNGNKVAGSDGARPLMNLGNGLLPDDIDYEWYVARTEKMMSKLGIDQ